MNNTFLKGFYSIDWILLSTLPLQLMEGSATQNQNGKCTLAPHVKLGKPLRQPYFPVLVTTNDFQNSFLIFVVSDFLFHNFSLREY